MFSHYTATGPSWLGRPYEHGRASSLARLLIEQGFDVYAIIDPGTIHEPDVVEVLSAMALMDYVIDGGNPRALAQLDAIAIRGAANLRDEVIQGITRAVESGVGLVTYSGCGAVNPGAEDAALGRLLGVSGGGYVFRPGTLVCPVVKAHPILGSLEAGDELVVEMFSGLSGDLDGIPLLAPPFGMEADFCPLYVRELGKGRVVRFQWAGMPHITENCSAAELFEKRMFSGDRFIARCVNWAAGLPADQRW